MSDGDLKLLRIYKGARFERGHEYFDLNNPARGAFVADGREGWITDHTYACRDNAPEEVWAKLVTWSTTPTDRQADAIRLTVEDFRTPPERSAAGQPEPVRQRAP